MFSYYGTKKKISKFYPKPKFDKIVEPFCGAAMFSLYDNNWKSEVILNDKYDKVYIIWDWLINKAKKSDIENLPDLKVGLNLDTISSLSIEEKAFLGFFCNPSSAQPKKTVTARGENSWNRHKNNIIENLPKVKHWKIYNKSYDQLDNIEATWFIDPPYQFGGEYYHSSSSNKWIDYNELRDWTLSRSGEIIVCENSKADWMDFKPLVQLKGQLHTTLEVIYHDFL